MFNVAYQHISTYIYSFPDILRTYPISHPLNVTHSLSQFVILQTDLSLY